MSAKNRWGIFWAGIATAGIGGAMLLFQIDNAAIGAPQNGTAWILGTVMVAAGAWAFGWARESKTEAILNEAGDQPISAIEAIAYHPDPDHVFTAEEIYAAGGDAPGSLADGLADFIRIRADVTAVLLDAADQLDLFYELEPTPARAALATRLREMGQAP